MNPSDPIRQAWQASASDAPLPAIDDLRAGVDRFYRIVRNRNRVEYGASLFVVIAFAAIAFNAPLPATKIGAVLVVLGTFIVAWQLHRRASIAAPPADVGIEPLLAHQRAQLARQHDALAKVGRWYLLPLLPGMLTMMFARLFDRGLAGVHDFRWNHIVSIAVVFAVFGGIWWLNQRAARKLKKTIDEIDALTGEGE